MSTEARIDRIERLLRPPASWPATEPLPPIGAEHHQAFDEFATAHGVEDSTFRDFSRSLEGETGRSTRQKVPKHMRKSAENEVKS